MTAALVLGYVVWGGAPGQEERFQAVVPEPATAGGESPLVHVLNVTQVPDQTPWETVQDAAEPERMRLPGRAEPAAFVVTKRRLPCRTDGRQRVYR